MDEGGAAAGVGPWATSIHDGPHTFSKGVFLFSGEKGTLGGSTLLIRYVSAGTEAYTTGNEGRAGLAT